MTLKLSDNAIRILKERYLDEGETPEQRFTAMVESICLAEEKVITRRKVQKELMEVIMNQKILPNTPAIMNYGKPERHQQGSACFVLPIEDDLENIFETVKRAALIHKTGGGTGFNFSNLRPRGAIVKTTGKASSGVVPFIKSFDAATGAVSQGGVRKGANMGILNVYHPDILEFITCKQDNQDIQNFNLSVGATEEFFEAVKNDKDWELYFTDLNKNVMPFILDSKSLLDDGLLAVYQQVEAYVPGYGLLDEEFVKTKKPIKNLLIKAKNLFNMLCQFAHKNGEPGILFIDRMQRANSVPGTVIVTTNPCVTGDTLVQTVEGLIPIKELVGKEIDVYCMDDKGQLTISKATNIVKTRENAKLMRIITSRGELRCTPDHPIFTKNRGYVEARELLLSDKIVGLNRKMNNEKYCAIGLTGTSYVNEHRFIMRHYEDINGKDVHHKDENTLHNVKSNLEVLSHSDHSRLSNIGHEDWMDRDAEGKYLPKEIKAKKEQLQLNQNAVGVNLKLLNIEYLPEAEDVYDLTVDVYHNFIANGLVIHNCGEQPLPPNNSCVLASANLVKHFDFTRKTVDWKALDETIRIGVRMLDNIVTKNEYPIPEIKDNHDKQRRIGLGYTGLGDVLMLMGIPYGSKEGRAHAADIQEYFTNRSHYHSFQLAKEKGNFPLFEESIFNLQGKYKAKALEVYSKFLSEKEFKELIANPKATGYMRNAATTTVAPTGSLTNFLGTECYGCEPIFALGYVRNILDGQDLIYVSEVFKIVAKREGFYSDALMEEVARKGSVQHCVDVPKKWKDVFKIANELSAYDHIMMLNALQQYCDAGISKTINLPSTASLEDVVDAYWLSYTSKHIKGMTVYRDKSRDSAPITVGIDNKEDTKVEVACTTEEVVEAINNIDIEDTVEDDVQILPIVRPKRAEGTTTQMNTGCGKIYATINHDDKSIIEMFAFTGSNGGCEGLTQGLSRIISYTIRLSRAFAEELDLNVTEVMDATIYGLIDQLTSVRCGVAMRNSKSEGKSCPDILGKALRAEYDEYKKAVLKVVPELDLGPIEEAIACKDEEGGCKACDNYSLCHQHVEEIAPSIIAVTNAITNIDIANAKKTCKNCGTPLIPMEGCGICPNCGVGGCD